MKKFTIVMTVCLLICNYSFGTNLAVNGGFETSETTSGGWPDSYGDWNGDYSAIVGATGGVMPYEGSQMLQFRGTSHGGTGSSDTSEIFQLIDISAYNSLVVSGNATVKTSVHFNRVDTDSQTDTKAFINLMAYDGSTGTFDTRWESNTYASALSYTTNRIYLDDNLQTWEELELELFLPSETTFVALRIGLHEDIYNDYSYPEFDGHFVDAVFVEIIPEPATIALLICGVGMLRKYKRLR